MHKKILGLASIYIRLHLYMYKFNLVPRLGFEPRFPGPEPGVLPLDDLGLTVIF